MIKLIEERINQILLENGLYDDDETVQNQLLSEMNSLSFIQFVVTIENTFNIGIPDEYLLLSYFKNKNNIIQMLSEVIRENEKNSFT